MPLVSTAEVSLEVTPTPHPITIVGGAERLVPRVCADADAPVSFTVDSGMLPADALSFDWRCRCNASAAACRIAAGASATAEMTEPCAAGPTEVTVVVWATTRPSVLIGSATQRLTITDATGSSVHPTMLCVSEHGMDGGVVLVNPQRRVVLRLSDVGDTGMFHWKVSCSGTASPLLTHRTDGPVLTLRPALLPEGGSCSIRCSASKKGCSVTATAELALITAGAPWGGGLDVDASLALKGLVVARAVGWTDFARLRPLQFVFAAAAAGDGGQDVALSFDGDAPEAALLLPLQNASSSTVTIVLTVTNAAGVAASTRRVVSVARGFDVGGCVVAAAGLAASCMGEVAASPTLTVAAASLAARRLGSLGGGLTPQAKRLVRRSLLESLVVAESQSSLQVVTHRNSIYLFFWK